LRGVPNPPFKGEAEHRSEARSASAYTLLSEEAIPEKRFIQLDILMSKAERIII